MYESFFGLHERPFSAAPNADEYFPAASCETARQTLARVIERREGAGLLIGSTGAGKTLLCLLLADQFRQQKAVAWLSRVRIDSPRTFLQAVLYELGLPYRGLDDGELRLSLLDHVTRCESPDNGLLVILDDAQALGLRVLQEARMLASMARDGQPVVQLVLSGGPALEERLASPKLDSLSQMLAARAYLSCFTREETAAYIQHQMERTQQEGPRVFGESALEAIYTATEGIPRLVNQLCDHALVLAFASGQPTIDAAGVQEAWADLQQLPGPSGTHHMAQPAAFFSTSDDVVEFSALESDEPDRSPAAAAFDLVDSPSQAADRHLQAIETQLSALVGDSSSPSSIGPPEVEFFFREPVRHQADSFVEEEVVLDHYTEMDPQWWQERPRVDSRRTAPWVQPLPTPLEVEEFSRPNLQVVHHEEEPRLPEPLEPAPAPTAVTLVEPIPAAAPQASPAATAFEPAAPAFEYSAPMRPSVVRPVETAPAEIAAHAATDSTAAAKTPHQRSEEPPSSAKRYRQLFSRLRQG